MAVKIHNDSLTCARGGNGRYVPVEGGAWCEGWCETPHGYVVVVIDPPSAAAPGGYMSLRFIYNGRFHLRSILGREMSDLAATRSALRFAREIVAKEATSCQP